MVLDQKHNLLKRTSFLLKNHLQQLLTRKDSTFCWTGKNMLTWKPCESKCEYTYVYV